MAFETVMVACFGISWPFSVAKSYRARTTRGKSLVFLLAIWIGYIFGVAGKIMQAVELGSVAYVFYFYVFNLIVVSADLILYFRNHRLDRMAMEEAGGERPREGSDEKN